MFLVSACRRFSPSSISTSIPLRLVPVDFAVGCALVAVPSTYALAFRLGLFGQEVG